jgi:hypothetical protein
MARQPAERRPVGVVARATSAPNTASSSSVLHGTRSSTCGRGSCTAAAPYVSIAPGRVSAQMTHTARAITRIDQKG